MAAGAMPRCYMVKKLAPRVDAAAAAEPPPPTSPSEGSVAPGYQHPGEHRANTESRQAEAAAEYEELRSAPMSEQSAAEYEELRSAPVPEQSAAEYEELRSAPVPEQSAAEYEELRSAPMSERSAADTEAAHELLSLAAGVPPLPPATVLTVLRAPEPIIPIYTYTLQPTTIYILSDEQAEPMYHAVQTIPLHQVEYTTIENQQVSYFSYPDSMPPPPPLEYHPSPHQQVACIVDSPPPPPPSEQSGLTTLSIEEMTDSDSEQCAIQVPVIEPVPQQQAPPPPPEQDDDDDSDEDTLCIVTPTVKQKPSKFDCNECGKRYATSSNLSRHKQTHRSLDSNSAKKCGECGKAYVSMPALAMHVLTHRMGHVCGICGKQFSRPWLLRGHLRSHTGEKPFNCGYCSKAFADRSNLRAHLQTHSVDKSHECPRCKKNFALKSYLNKHQEVACSRDDEDEGGASA